MKENIWCWPFGILSSLLSIFLFIEAKLYSEAILYFFFALVGVYGWYKWKHKTNQKSLIVRTAKPQNHLIWILLGLAAAYGLGSYFKNNSDAEAPFWDAHTTIFSFIASYLEANKILSSWVYWIIINGVSIWLYFIKGLEIYAGLMVIYFFLSFVGYLEWRKSHAENVSSQVI